jgi:hypothetical protein
MAIILACDIKTRKIHAVPQKHQIGKEGQPQATRRSPNDHPRHIIVFTPHRKPITLPDELVADRPIKRHAMVFKRCRGKVPKQKTAMRGLGLGRIFAAMNERD